MLLVAPTGSGKTTVAAAIIARAVDRGERVLFLAHRRELIDQAYARVLGAGLVESEVGVLMANDGRRRPGAAVQVASIDTLRQRAHPRADVVFIDEAHRALSASYRKISAAYPHALHIGLTATPYRADGKGLGDAYDELIVVASPRELIAEGYLVEPRIFTVPRERRPDLRRVRVKAGDYSARELEEAVDRQGLVGNIVEHWQRHAPRVRTICFAVSVAHSKHIVERFVAAGVPAEHLDGGTETSERDAILARLRDGRTLLVSNVGVLCEGTDIPPVKCAILARPTKSAGLYLQQAGRILRPWEDQQAIILDHGGCALEHGLPQDDREFTLESEPKRARRSGEPLARECPGCSAVVALGTRVCPACGLQLFADRELPTEIEEALEEVRAGEGVRNTPPTRCTVSVPAILRGALATGGRVAWSAFDARGQGVARAL